MHYKLKTFLKVADAGSFNKAAEELLISAPAIIKQINSLETGLELQLFQRTSKGLTLTEAGQSFYHDVKYILQQFDEAAERARKIYQRDKNLIRIGTSIMTPGEFLVDLWPSLCNYLPDMKFQLVPFHNTPENARYIEKNFEKDIDICVGVFDERFLQERFCAGTLLSHEPLRIAVPFSHRLYKKEILQIEDLFDENLMLIQRNWNSDIDRLRDDILRLYPRIKIVDFAFYAVEAYNRCEKENNLILTLDRWSGVHPLMKTLPVNWEYTIAFGILHSQQPSKRVQTFLRAVQRVINK